MIWTVAISKRKSRFHLIDKDTNKIVATYEDEKGYNKTWFLQREFNEKYRLDEMMEPFEPGDIVDFKTIGRENEWTEEERKEFLIVTLVGTDFRQMEEGMVEPLYGSKKRRMSLPLDAIGQGRVIPVTKCFDKLKNRNITDDDKLRKME